MNSESEFIPAGKRHMKRLPLLYTYYIINLYLHLYHLNIFVHMYIIPGKKSASWQLVAVVLGAKNDAKWQKPTWNFQNQAKIKGNIRLISKNSFLVAVVFKIYFQVWCTYDNAFPDTRYSPGESLDVNCSTENSRPPTNLTWYLNNKLVIYHA